MTQDSSTLRSLADWNIERQRYWYEMRDKVNHPERYGNGFACPDCAKELYDTGQALTVAPAMLRVKCRCGFVGSRYE